MVDGTISTEEQQAIDQATALANSVRALKTEEANSGRMISGAPASYWLDLRGYDPPSGAKLVKAPMLILHGERDYQITAEEFARWKAALGSRRDVTVHSYPALNHLFIAGTGPGLPAEYQVPGHVAEEGRAPFEITDEYDVQDLLHAVLKLHFDDVRPEEWTPSYAGNSSRMDFFLKREQIVVEAKMTREGLDQKEVANQLIQDKERYKGHPDCKALVCLVYDPAGLCQNPTALESDLSESGTQGLAVSVIVRPKGL